MPRDSEYAICPHCGEQHGDGWEWITGDPHDCKCQGCGKTFTVWADYSVEYITQAKED